MKAGAIKDYSDRVKRLLWDAHYRPVSYDPKGIDPYTPAKLEGEYNADAPFTVATVQAWSPELEREPEAWKSLFATAKHSWALTYPTANHVHIEAGTIPSGKVFPIVAAQTYAKLRRSVRGNLIIADLDVIAYHPTNPFEMEFDVGLTDCDDLWPSQPFNAGVLFLRDTPAAQDFCDTCAQITTAIPGNIDPWYMYQIAMRIAYDMLRETTEFMVFPHAEYNFTPEDVFEETDAFFVHSRGQRKNLQYEYYKRLLARHQPEGASE